MISVPTTLTTAGTAVTVATPVTPASATPASLAAPATPVTRVATPSQHFASIANDVPGADTRRCSALDTVEDRWRAAAAAMHAGRPVLLTDDGDRENEADLIMPAATLTVPVMAMMIREGSGIVCLCITPQEAKRLQLAPMVQDNRSRYGTAFTVSIEAREGVSTGVSAADRVSTVRAATEAGRGAADIVSPGHIFPLVAHAGGVLARRGHTEGALELCALAGLPAAAVLCELMNADGTMARGAEVQAFAKRHGLPVLAIDDLVAWRRQGAAALARV